MDIMKLLELLNYNYDSYNKDGKSQLYNVYIKFIEANEEIMTEEQLKDAKENLLPPQAFTDSKKREESEYKDVQNKIQMILTKKLDKGRGMLS